MFVAPYPCWVARAPKTIAGGEFLSPTELRRSFIVALVGLWCVGVVVFAWQLNGNSLPVIFSLLVSGFVGAGLVQIISLAVAVRRGRVRVKP